MKSREKCKIKFIENVSFEFLRQNSLTFIFLELIGKQFSVFLPKELEDRIILVSHLLCLNNVTSLFFLVYECTYGYEETTTTLDLL